MGTENYKKRAGDVRRSARAELLEIRKARIARRGAMLGQSGPLTAQLQNDLTNAMPETAPPVVATGDSAEDTQSQEVDFLDELAVRNAALAEIADPLKGEQDSLPGAALAQNDALMAENLKAYIAGATNAPLMETPVPAETDNAAGAPAETAQPVADWSQYDLAQLPGAGPGLVWMLVQCDITSLAQLANQDSGALATRLGVVGQILDVGKWVQYAQDRVQT